MQAARSKQQASEELIEVRGCMSRTEWELVYVAASQFAQAHGLSITRFDLQSAELDGQGQGTDAAPRPSVSDGECQDCAG